jgi:prevent-host-death family protein
MTCLTRLEVVVREVVSVAEAKSKFAEYVRRAETGDVVVLSRHGKPVAAIVAAGDADQVARLRAAGPEKGLCSIAGGWQGSEDLVAILAGKKRSRPRKVGSLD